jgi:sulfur-oxidizing protein SoxX
MDRLEQDAVKRACNLHADNPPESVTKPLEQAQLDAIRYPTGSLLGDWKSGAKIAESGRGMQWHEKPEEPGGGGCYNCHQLSREQASY